MPRNAGCISCSHIHRYLRVAVALIEEDEDILDYDDLDDPDAFV